MSSVVAGNSVYSNTGRRGASSGNNQKIEKFFIRLIILLITIIIFEIVFHFYIAPSLFIKKIEIISGPELGLSESDVLTITGLDTKMNYFEVRNADIAGRLLAIPAVRNVAVKKVFPSTLILTITARNPVGVFLVNSGSATIPMAVDSDGILFPLQKNNSSFIDYPVISGVYAPDIKNGARLPLSLCSFMKDLDMVRNAAPQLSGLISEVKFVKKEGLDYEVVIYPVNSKVRVRIGNELDVKLLKYMVMILDVISMQSGMDNLEEIDLRTGEAVYRIRGE